MLEAHVQAWAKSWSASGFCGLVVHFATRIRLKPGLKHRQSPALPWSSMTWPPILRLWYDQSLPSSIGKVLKTFQGSKTIDRSAMSFQPPAGGFSDEGSCENGDEYQDPRR